MSEKGKIDGDKNRLERGLLEKYKIENPQDITWRIHSILVDSNNCVCGARIKKCYRVFNPLNEEFIIIGSTCISHLKVEGFILKSAAWDSLISVREDDKTIFSKSAIEAIVRYGIVPESLVGMYPKSRDYWFSDDGLRSYVHLVNRMVNAYLEWSQNDHDFQVGFDWPPRHIFKTSKGWEPTYEPSEVPENAKEIEKLEKTPLVTKFSNLCNCKPPKFLVQHVSKRGNVGYICANNTHCKYLPSLPDSELPDASLCDCNPPKKVVAHTNGPHRCFACANWTSGCGWVAPSERGPRIAPRTCKCDKPTRTFPYKGQAYHGCPDYPKGCGSLFPDVKVPTEPRRKRSRRY